jgi:hypothetical protein
MKKIMDVLQSTLMAHLMSRVPLRADLLIGQDTAEIDYATYFYPGQDVIVRNTSIGEGFVIESVADSHHVTFEKPATANWTVADSCVVERSPEYHHLKYVLRGDPQVIPDYPAITISPGSRSIEWQTLQATFEEFTMDIYVYVLEDSQESSTDLLTQYADATTEVLMLNLFPEISAHTINPIAVYTVGDRVLDIGDTTGFHAESVIVIEDLKQREMKSVSRVLDASRIEVADPLALTWNSSIDPFRLSRVIRMISDSRVKSVEYGFVQKGSAFLKAAHISWYGKEMRDRKYPFAPLNRPWMHHIELPPD